MANEVTLGGERLGSGKKQKIKLKGYERSNHNLSRNWKSTMAAGTLIPFMKILALNGDQFKIKLNSDVLTHPTIGPLFGSYKLQLDVFSVPIRLYQAQLHNNKLGIGNDMAKIKLPQLKLEYKQPVDNTEYIELNPSSLLSYLGITSIGRTRKIPGSTETKYSRTFNAIPYLGYFDIFKNYYANKQEDNAYIIHRAARATNSVTTGGIYTLDDNGYPTGTTKLTLIISVTQTPPVWDTGGTLILNYSDYNDGIVLDINSIDDATTPTLEDYTFAIAASTSGASKETINGADLFDITHSERTSATNYRIIAKVNQAYSGMILTRQVSEWADDNTTDREPLLIKFPLKEIDEMRENILAAIKDPTAFELNQDATSTVVPAVYRYPLQGTMIDEQKPAMSSENSQEGLLVKTYQSDIFNNWINTDWIDGVDGISNITAISTAGDEFTIDTLNLSMKVYYMLNRIAMSGGTYDDWQETVYDHKIYRKAETPIYLGGLSKELVFQQVISNSGGTSEGVEQPLGTLAGRGVLTNKHKGGYIDVQIDEPSYIMGIVSLTPRLCYSQGNEWDIDLKTMDDLHKPQLDEIGFQDLIVEQMAAWTTDVRNDGTIEKKTAGKQPAWLNYMTSYDVAKGNFASGMNENFMVLDRNYAMDLNNETTPANDITTYIDPAKYNNTFAYTKRDAQNFWIEIDSQIEVRRKMSAKVMPNL